MNSIKITSFEFESPGSEKIIHIENNSEKSQNDNNEDFTSSEKNDKIFQNLMSLSKIKNSNFEINSSTNKKDNNNSKLSIEELDTNKVQETINKENNIVGNILQFQQFVIIIYRVKVISKLERQNLIIIKMIIMIVEEIFLLFSIVQ